MLKDVGDNEGKVTGTGPGTQEIQLVGFHPYHYHYIILILILILIITVRETLSLRGQGFAHLSPQHALRKTSTYKRKKKLLKTCPAGQELQIPLQGQVSRSHRALERQESLLWRER